MLVSGSVWQLVGRRHAQAGAQDLGAAATAPGTSAAATIVNWIASATSYVGLPRKGCYTSSKHAFMATTKMTDYARDEEEQSIVEAGAYITFWPLYYLPWYWLVSAPSLGHDDAGRTTQVGTLIQV